MTLNRNHVEWFSLVFFMVLVGIVFQQVNTDLVEQGIAGGDAFHNAAFYPQAVALLILGAVFVRTFQLTIEIKNSDTGTSAKKVSELFRPLQLIILFSLYLFLLGILGYHLTTTPFIALVILVCGDRKPFQTVLFSLVAAFLIAFLFEKYLKIVLPGGVFSLNIPW